MWTFFLGKENKLLKCEFWNATYSSVLTTQSCSPCLNCLGCVLFLSPEHPQKLRSDWGSIKKKKNHPCELCVLQDYQLSMWQDSLNTARHERLLKSPAHTACGSTYLTVDQCVYRDSFSPLTSPVCCAAQLSPPPTLALGRQPLRVRDGPHQRLGSGSHHGCRWVSSMRTQPSYYEGFIVIHCHFNEWNSMLSRLRSSSFPQVTWGPSWWSTRRRCTSLQTVGRHGDRYVTSSSSRRPCALDFLSPSQHSKSVRYPCGEFQRHSGSRQNFSPSGSGTIDRSVSLLCQVFEEEHHILYLDHGGVIVAIKDTSIPLKILKWEYCQEPHDLLWNLYAAWIYSWAFV